MRVTNTLFGTTPLVIHAQGHHDYKPLWPPIRDRFFASPPRVVPAPAELTILTCNNGHPAMGLLERSLEHLGLPYVVAGQGVRDWRNARDKPRAIVEALTTIATPYTLYADSRDAIVIDDPSALIGRFESFACDLVFSADRMNWPPLSSFRAYEDSLAAGSGSDFRYLNGGIWIGRSEFCREFVARVADVAPIAEANDSEQGLLKQLLPLYARQVKLDYRCSMFQNIGFIGKPILRID